MSRLPPSMWCDRPIGYNSSYPLRCWVLLSDWSALDPIRFCISPLASHPLLKLLLSLSAGCLSLIALGLLGVYPRPLSSIAAGVVAQLNTSIPNIYASCSRCGIDLGRPSHLSICSSDLHSASTKLLRMVSYVVQTLLFLIWRTLIFRRPVDSSHVRTMIVPPGQSCCIFTSARSFLILS
ncbi:unnamed protein product [Microthlaspi erraticum]|uniref:Uncharacterized protein n=1 Tax=Microthlaspi erraticum TaxID=1685480 RepID=A0A6D2LK32_9BRAS|nr:unnamed protein product [Microthlaspi erraticum]